MARPSCCPPETVESIDGLPCAALPARVGSGDGRERILDVLRAGGLRFRDGARWRPAL
ncbi:hypothetical protein ACFOOK_20420 [Micromonospora krabiensis]|uniref:Uncharacterized protein n=1 Tax=Micromonospora krabiensis TaxID=307121 RepID=A0A1C3N949_9ACTN|nr:hypothetical protein [Micromonospora krabiensis]SBV29066.1 hypothetical protein GA0070620_4628 [Micromonospora krabiensis]